MRFWPLQKTKSLKESSDQSSTIPPFHREEESLEMQIERVKLGDSIKREQLIRMYRPFVMRVTSQFFRRFVDPSIDDGFSIGLIAFNEAIDAFRMNGGAAFLTFAETVIRRRLTDWVRKEVRFRDQVPMSSFEKEDDGVDSASINAVEIEAAQANYQIQNENHDRKAEVQAFETELQRFGFGFADLVEIAPKHEDTRQSLWRIAAVMVHDQSIREKWTTTKRIPIQELANRCGVSIKMLEKHRKTVIAYSILAIGEFPYLKAYLHPRMNERGGVI